VLNDIRTLPIAQRRNSIAVLQPIPHDLVGISFVIIHFIRFYNYVSIVEVANNATL